MKTITIGIDQLKSLMEKEFDWEAYERGRTDARNFAKEASYKEFVEKRKECVQRIESCSFGNTPGPSYWVGCLLELDMVRIPDAVFTRRKGCVVLPSDVGQENDEQMVIVFTDMETKESVFYHFDKRLSSNQAKDLLKIVEGLMKDSLSLDKQKALFKGVPKFMEKYSMNGYMIPSDIIHIGEGRVYLEKQKECVFGFIPEDKKGSILGIEQNGNPHYLYVDSRLDEKTLQQITDSMQEALEGKHGLSIYDICKVLSSCIPDHGDGKTGYNSIQMYFAEF